MSMNLECSELDLWQTPTWVTYICFSNYDGGWMGSEIVIFFGLNLVLMGSGILRSPVLTRELL